MIDKLITIQYLLTLLGAFVIGYIIGNMHLYIHSERKKGKKENDEE